MSTQRISQRYARSLFEIAESEQALETTAKDMESIVEVIHHSPEFAKFLQSPLIRERRKAEILHHIFDKKLQPLTLQFIRLLVRKGRAPLLKALSEAFVSRYEDYKNIVSAQLLVAKEMHKEEVAQIEKYISRLTDRRPRLKIYTNPELLGGFVLRFDDKQLDKSIATQLRHIQKSLVASVN